MKKKVTVLAAAACAACLVAGCANAVKDGTDALTDGRYEEAETSFQEAAESTDKEVSADGWRGLGMTYYEMEKYEEALSAFQSALDQGADQTVELYNLMGVCAMQTGEYGQALEYIQAGLALNETDAEKGKADDSLIQEMKYNEIICYEQQADWENAKQKAAEYAEAYPGDEAIQKEVEFLETR